MAARSPFLIQPEQLIECCLTSQRLATARIDNTKTKARNQRIFRQHHGSFNGCPSTNAAPFAWPDQSDELALLLPLPFAMVHSLAQWPSLLHLRQRMRFLTSERFSLNWCWILDTCLKFWVFCRRAISLRRSFQLAARISADSASSNSPVKSSACTPYSDRKASTSSKTIESPGLAWWNSSSWKPWGGSARKAAFHFFALVDAT